jgi:phosphatidylglycerol---prolipoprotein diacylglyceryl transferase
VIHQIASIGWPVLDRFRFGRFAISPHGIGIAVGFLTGAWLLNRIGPRRGLDPDHLNSLVLWALVGAIIGSRLFYVISHFSEFSHSGSVWSDIGQMFSIWRGGISLLGGIAGAVLINLPRVRRYGYRFFQAVDPFAICLSLGIAVGRIGDLIIGDHLGKPTSWFLAWTYKGGTLAPPWVCDSNGVCRAALQNGQLEIISRGSAQLQNVKGIAIATGVGVHQTALYDMILAWGLFFLLWNMNKKPRREGILTLTFGLYYGLCRLLEDSLRIDKRFGPFTGSQWTALVVAIVCATVLIWWAFHPQPPGEDSEQPDDASGEKQVEDGEPVEASAEKEPAATEEEPAESSGSDEPASEAVSESESASEPQAPPARSGP